MIFELKPQIIWYIKIEKLKLKNFELLSIMITIITEYVIVSFRFVFHILIWKYFTQCLNLKCLQFSINYYKIIFNFNSYSFTFVFLIFCQVSSIILCKKMFCFTCTSKLWTAVVATVSKRYYEPLSLHRQIPVHIRNITIGSSFTSSAAQVQNIKKRVQRRKSVAVEDTRQEQGVNI